MICNGKHEYGLDWIDQDALFDVTLATFSRALGIDPRNNNNPPDPFTIITQSAVTGATLDECMSFEQIRKINKTISNAVGTFHQRVLGLAPNWENLGTNGGLIDLRTVYEYEHPQFSKPVVAEVKNRFNTIKAAEEPDMWDKIDHATKVMGGAQGYLFQITPRTPDRYDKMWAPSNRTPRSHIRVCDGATASELVYGVPHAMRDLFLVLPEILTDIKRANGIPTPVSAPSREQLLDLYKSVYPE